MRACSNFWESGTATMLTAALVASVGALTVALIDARVPVFEVVVRLLPCAHFVPVKALHSLCMHAQEADACPRS